MGQDNPAVKPLLLAFGEGAVFVTLPTTAKIPVWLFDYTSSLKFMPKVFDFKTETRVKVKTGYDFLMHCFLKKLLSAYNKGATVVYTCLDRGSPPNKIIEQELRNVGVVPMETPADYCNSPALVNDHQMLDIETENDWKSFIGNPNLYRRLVHYITMRMIGTRGDIDEELQHFVRNSPGFDYDDELEDFALDHHHDKKLFLHGGRLRMPDPDRPRAFKYPDPFLLEFKTVATSTSSSLSSNNVVENGRPLQSSSNGFKHVANNRYSIRRSVQINRAYDSNVINNLLEGEIAALYYAQPHIERGDNVMIITPDIDVLMILLLSCPDRIDPGTGRFACEVWVKLVVSQKGLSRYVDVHQLWCNIHATRPLKRFGVPSLSSVPSDNEFTFRFGSKSPNEFVSKLCAMCLLCGTDYVKFYCLGITNRTEKTSDDVLATLFGPSSHDRSHRVQRNKGRENMDENSFVRMEKVKQNIEELALMPWIVHTFLKYYDEFENMITITRYRGFEPHMKIRTNSEVDIDESLFIEFTRRVYVEHYTTSKKHKNSFAKLYEKNATTQNVRRFLNEDAITKMKERMEAQKRQEARLKKPGAKIPKNLINVDETKTRIRIKRNRMPPPRKIRVSCRHLLWQLKYMLNGYKMDCSIIDPTTLYYELPYYGWHIEEGRIKIAPRVSIKRPNVQEIKTKCIANKRALVYRSYAAPGEEDEEEEEEEDNYDIDAIRCLSSMNGKTRIQAFDHDATEDVEMRVL